MCSPGILCRPRTRYVIAKMTRAMVMRRSLGSRAGVSPCDVEDGRGPGGEEVENRDELREERRQEGPPPPEQPRQRHCHRHVENIVRRRCRPAEKGGKEENLQEVGGEGDETGQTDAAGGESGRAARKANRPVRGASGLGFRDLGPSHSSVIVEGG